ncbi:MAG: Rrf2 family transcriptional regulator [bacterium]
MSRLLKISEAASIGLHAMTYLASKNTHKPVSTARLAADLRVSEAHLSKIVQRLVKAGLLKSVRGPSGGVLITKPADEITLLDIYGAIDGPVDIPRCILSQEVCKPGECIFGGLLESVSRQVESYLSRTKLSELTGVF